MFDAKSLKMNKKDEPIWKVKLNCWWYNFWPVKKFYDLQTFLRRSKRLYHWSKFMWTNWDFDALTIYPLLEYKLKRVQNALVNGGAWQEPKVLKALRVAIKLAKRLSNDYYEMKYYDWHDKKWGEVDYRMDNGFLKSKRSGVNTEEDGQKEWEDRKIQYSKAEKWQTRDEKWFFEIVRKNLRVWWD